MISNGKELYIFLDDLFKPQGFVRKKDTYYRSSQDCIVFFSIGKSEFVGRYESVMGGFYKKLLGEEVEFPKYFESHLRYGLENFVDKSLVRRVFDLKNGEFRGNEREILIREFFELYIIPFLKDVSTIDGIKESLRKYEGLTNRTTVDLKAALGIPFEQ